MRIITSNTLNKPIVKMGSPFSLNPSPLLAGATVSVALILCLKLTRVYLV